MTLTTPARKHQYGGNGQRTTDLACLDHAYAIRNWHPNGSSHLSKVRPRSVNLSELAGSEDIGWVQYGIHSGHVVNQGFNVTAGIPRLLEAFTHRGFAERFAGLRAPAGNFKGKPSSKKPILTDKQYFFISHRNQTNSGSVIVDEKSFLLRTEACIDSQDTLITVPVFEVLLQNSWFGHVVGSLVDKFTFDPGCGGSRYPVSNEDRENGSSGHHGKLSQN